MERASRRAVRREASFHVNAKFVSYSGCAEGLEIVGGPSKSRGRLSRTRAPCFGPSIPVLIGASSKPESESVVDKQQWLHDRSGSTRIKACGIPFALVLSG